MLSRNYALAFLVSILFPFTAAAQDPPPSGGGGDGGGGGIPILCEDFVHPDTGVCVEHCICPGGETVSPCEYMTINRIEQCMCQSFDPVAELCDDETEWCTGPVDEDGCFIAEECSDGSLHIDCPDGWYVCGEPIDQGCIKVEAHDGDPDTLDVTITYCPGGGLDECTMRTTTRNACLILDCGGGELEWCHASDDDPQCPIEMCNETVICPDGREVSASHWELEYSPDYCEIIGADCVPKKDPCDLSCPPYYKCPGPDGVLVPWCGRASDKHPVEPPEDPEDADGSDPDGGGGGGGCGCKSNPEALCPKKECVVINKIPYEITDPGWYRLGRDFFEPDAEYGINIAGMGRGVTLYLDNHILVGGLGSGITCTASTCEGVTIIGPGIIADWNTDGIYLNGTSHRVVDLDVFVNEGIGIYVRDGIVENILAEGNDNIGMMVEGGSVINSRAPSNGLVGIHATRASVSGCTAMRNNIGFKAAYSTVTDCVANHNNTGMIAVGSNVTGNVFHHNYVQDLDAGTGCNVTGNTFTECGDLSVRVGNSCLVDGNNVSHARVGISVTGIHSRVTNNNVTECYTGINSMGGGNIVHGNSVLGADGFSWIRLMNARILYGGPIITPSNEHEERPHSNFATSAFGGGKAASDGETVSEFVREIKDPRELQALVDPDTYKLITAPPADSQFEIRPVADKPREKGNFLPQKAGRRGLR